MFCTHCGNELPDEAKFCPKCGARVNPVLLNQKDSKEKKRTTTGTRQKAGEAANVRSAHKKKWPFVLIICLSAAVIGVLLGVSFHNELSRDAISIDYIQGGILCETEEFVITSDSLNSSGLTVGEGEYATDFGFREINVKIENKSSDMLAFHFDSSDYPNPDCLVAAGSNALYTFETLANNPGSISFTLSVYKAALSDSAEEYSGVYQGNDVQYAYKRGEIVYNADVTITFSGEGSSEEATEAEADSSWKSDSTGSTQETESTSLSDVYRAYLDFVESDYPSESEYSEYQLIYIDDDDIPELWINSMVIAAGAKICTYSGGDIEYSNADVNGYFKYIEKGGMFYMRGGRQGWYYDEIYSLKEGAFTREDGGTYHSADEDYSSGNYIYEWDDESVSKEDYEARLEAAFDFDNASDIQDGYSYSYDAFCDYLKSLIF